MSNNLKKLSGLTLVLSLAFSSATPADGDKNEGWRTKAYNKGAYIAIGGAAVAIGAIAYDYMNYKTWYEAQSEEYRDNNQMGLGNYFSDYLMGFKGETPSKVAQIAGVIGGVAGVAGTVCGAHKWWTSSSTPDVKKLEEERDSAKTERGKKFDELLAKAKSEKVISEDEEKLVKSGWEKEKSSRTQEEQAAIEKVTKADKVKTEREAFSTADTQLKEKEEALKKAKEKDDKKDD